MRASLRPDTLHEIRVPADYAGTETWRRQGVFSGRLSGAMAYEPGQRSGLPPRTLEALERGNRSEAIEQLRLERNLSPEEAREQVASYILSQPSLHRRMKDSQSETRWGIMGWLILLQAIVVALGYFLLFRE